ncbi:hypothetical protein D9M71_835450 [compost metagenome]
MMGLIVPQNVSKSPRTEPIADSPPSIQTMKSSTSRPMAALTSAIAAIIRYSGRFAATVTIPSRIIAAVA